MVHTFGKTSFVKAVFPVAAGGGGCRFAEKGPGRDGSKSEGPYNAGRVSGTGRSGPAKLGGAIGHETGRIVVALMPHQLVLGLAAGEKREGKE
jgi:hypothetical protein